MNQESLFAFIWSAADLLRGDYEHSSDGEVKPSTRLDRRRSPCFGFGETMESSRTLYKSLGESMNTLQGALCHD